MSKRETHKIVEISGRRWRIGKFDALTGSYIVYRLLFQMLPMGMEQMPDVQALNLPKGRGVMSKQEFMELQMDCLSVCSELVLVGTVESPISVLLNGVFSREGLQDDTLLVMALTVHALVFNVTSFFEEDALRDMVKSFQGLGFLNASVSKT
jgi:hypothetical protein